MSIAISFLKVSMVICLAMSILISCKKESSKKTPTCDGSHPTYNSAIKSIINGNCTSSGCHNAGSSNGDFTSYSGLAPYLNNGSFQTRSADQPNHAGKWQPVANTTQLHSVLGE
jgi:hypothetical protein